MIRPQPWYRAEAFSKGLKAAGFNVRPEHPKQVTTGDVLLIWNRYGDKHDLANRFEAAGGKVFVAENGYLGKCGSTPKFDVHPRGPKSEDYYALAVGGHNGSGSWPTGDGSRWDRLGIELKPWQDGEHILVCPSRVFGRPDMTMPVDWVARTVEELKSNTDRPIRVRAHPGNDTPQRPLSEDLKNAWAVVIWASSSGVHALINGIPVFQCAPHWICEKAAQRFEDIERPWRNDVNRLAAMHDLSWAQWTVSEIESGEPFKYL